MSESLNIIPVVRGESRGSLIVVGRRIPSAESAPQEQAPAERVNSAPTPWLTLNAVGELLQLSRAAAYRLPQDPSFPATRLGRTIRVERRALEAWLSARTQRSRRRPSDQ